MEREREIQRVRNTPTEELLGQWFLSRFRKNWHFSHFQYLELARRIGGGAPKVIFEMSNTTIDASRGVGEVAMGVLR